MSLFHLWAADVLWSVKQCRFVIFWLSLHIHFQREKERNRALNNYIYLKYLCEFLYVTKMIPLILFFWKVVILWIFMCKFCPHFIYGRLCVKGALYIDSQSSNLDTNAALHNNLNLLMWSTTEFSFLKWSSISLSLNVYDISFWNVEKNI